MKVAFNALSQHFNSAGFGEAGGALNQQMTISEDSDEKFSNQVGLANNLLTEPVFETCDCGVIHETITYSDVTQIHGDVLRQTQAQ